MNDNFTSGSFGEIVVGFSKFHDYQEVRYDGSGRCKLYTVISGERKLFLKAANDETGTLAENIARLQREYKLLERLYGNEHIVRCIGWREDAEVGPCIVMEYIDGETLAEYLKTSLSNKERKRILNELLDALAFVHQHQVVHNDLKPENILITRNGHNVKLIDFGYADSDANLDKATGGTTVFASPELLKQEVTDGTSDIYSLGFIIKALFPHRYAAVIRKCQHKEASRRYQRVSDVANAIHRCEMTKWLVMAVLAVSVTVLAWPKRTVDEVMVAEQTETVPSIVSVPDTVIFVQEYHDTVMIEPETGNSNALKRQPQPLESNDDLSETIDSAPVSVMNLDSAHRAYRFLYDKYKKAIKEGIADSSLKYIEFANFYRYHFADDMLELKLEMMPKKEEQQLVFEEDFQKEYIKLSGSLFNLYSYLPSYHALADDTLRQELKKKWDDENDKLWERQKRLKELLQQKARED